MKNTKSTLGKLCAALLATVSCCTLFTACGNGDETPAQHNHSYAATWTTDDNNHWHECKNSGCDEKEKDKAPHDWDDGVITTEATAEASGVKSYTCTVCDKTKTEAVKYVPSLPTLTENTDFAALVSDKVTEDQWKAAFAESSFSNCTIKHRDNQPYDRQQILKIDKTTERDNRKLASFRKEDEQWVERIPVLPSFWSVENNAMICYEYDYENQDFNTVYKYTISLENSDNNYQKMVDWMTTYKMACPDFGEFYSNFTYNNELHAYVCTSTLITNGMFEDWETNYTDITIKIVSGRVAYISVHTFNYEYDDVKNELIYVKDQSATELFFYDYGTTHVTMPTNAIDYPEQDEEEGPPHEE